MSLTYTIDLDQQLITITGDYADAEQWTELLGQLVTDSRLKPGFSVLRDLREGVVRAMAVVRKFWSHIQPSCAAILTRYDIDPAALVASAVADAHDFPVQIFHSVDAAMKWLSTDRVLGVLRDGLAL